MGWSSSNPPADEIRAYYSACAHAEATPHDVPYKTVAARFIPEIDELPDWLASLTEHLEDVLMQAYQDGYRAGLRDGHEDIGAFIA